MKRVVRQIILLALVLMLVCVLHRAISGHRYTMFIQVPEGAAVRGVHAVADRTQRLEVAQSEMRGEYARVEVEAKRRGDATVRVVTASGALVAGERFRVGRFMTVYDTKTGGFTDDSAVMLAFTLFCFSVACIMLRYYFSLRWTEYYAYNTIYAAGFSIFATLTGALMAYVSVRHLLFPADYPMLNAYREISHAGYQFMVATQPLMFAFAAAMAVSNAALIRHEGPGLKNMLGILVGVVLVSGEVLAWFLFRGLRRPAGRALEVFREVYATVFIYFECMLAGAMICALRSARHVPDYDRDYIIVLGCRFRTDGTLTPLLQGRVDRAIAFKAAQQAATGRRAVLIASGGQGSDEIMPEAEAMRRYMRSAGVPEGDIRTEDQSVNTYQNMAFSKAIIDAEMPGAAVAYATTNYHVFRSGVWAALAGLRAEGMGSPTKWWYWPNAFMRECAGLLKNRWRQEILLLAALSGFFLLLSGVLNG